MRAHGSPAVPPEQPRESLAGSRADPSRTAPPGASRRSRAVPPHALDYAASVDDPPPLPRRRPPGVLVVAIFLLVDAAHSLAELSFGLEPLFQRRLAAGDEPVAALFYGLILLRVIAAVGLLRGWRRAWVITMFLVGLSLVVSLTLYWNGEPRYVRMAVDVVVAFYLNQGAVRGYFEGRPANAERRPPWEAQPRQG